MSQQIQFQKNIDLSEKLASYMTSSRFSGNSFPSGANYVVFSATDKSLNALNDEIVKKRKHDGHPLIKAFETTDKKNPWTFAPVAY